MTNRVRREHKREVRICECKWLDKPRVAQDGRGGERTCLLAEVKTLSRNVIQVMLSILYLKFYEAEACVR